MNLPYGTIDGRITFSPNIDYESAKAVCDTFEASIRRYNAIGHYTVKKITQDGKPCYYGQLNYIVDQLSSRDINKLIKTVIGNTTVLKYTIFTDDKNRNPLIFSNIVV